MGKIKKQRAQIIKPCKRVPISYTGGIYKIGVRKGATLKANVFGFAGMLQGVKDLRRK